MTDMEHPPEPSAEDCDNHVQGQWNGRRTLALWYPQMGGHVGKAVAVADDGEGPDDPGDGPDVYVWHDGDFPFTGNTGVAQQPARLHLCEPDQFIGFGQLLADWA